MGNHYICCIHNGNNMAYVVGRKRKGKSGILTYYYLVEGYRKDRKVKQRIVKYLGTSPFQTEFDLDPKNSVRIARVLSEKNQSADTLKQQLEKLGISFPPGELKEARLIFKPPLQRLVVRISCA
jgi:hypothetical protein